VLSAQGGVTHRWRCTGQFLGSTWRPLLRPDLAIVISRRAQTPSRSAVTAKVRGFGLELVDQIHSIKVARLPSQPDAAPRDADGDVGACRKRRSPFVRCQGEAALPRWMPGRDGRRHHARKPGQAGCGACLRRDVQAACACRGSGPKRLGPAVPRRKPISTTPQIEMQMPASMTALPTGEAP
jgi:hypothetical protein